MVLFVMVLKFTSLAVWLSMEGLLCKFLLNVYELNVLNSTVMHQKFPIMVLTYSLSVSF